MCCYALRLVPNKQSDPGSGQRPSGDFIGNKKSTKQLLLKDLMIAKPHWNEILDILSIKQFTWSIESGELFRFTHPATSDVGLLYRCHANSFVSYSVNNSDDSIRIGASYYQVIWYGKDEQDKFCVTLKKMTGKNAGKKSVLAEIENA
jgi:hypothetical protein